MPDTAFLGMTTVLADVRFAPEERAGQTLPAAALASPRARDWLQRLDGLLVALIAFVAFVATSARVLYDRTGRHFAWSNPIF